MVNRLFCAALAATSLFLVACGGGDEPTASQQVAAAPFEGTAVVRGTTFDGQPPRFQALSAPIQATTPTIDFRYTELNGVAPLQALAAAEAALAVDTVTWDQLADYAERAYPNLFPGHQESFLLPHEGVNYTVRYYGVLPDSRGNYIGVTPDGRVYGYGHFTGYTLTQFGDLATWTGPRLVSAKIVSDDGQSVGVGGGDVSYKGTKLVLGYDKPPNCTGVDGTRRVGTIIATTYCDASAKTITLVPGLPGEVRWPAGTRNVVTVSGIFGQDGLPSPSVTISFTTRAATAQVYVGNFQGNFYTSVGLSIIDRTTQAVRKIDFGGGFQFLGGSLAASRVAGVVYVAPHVSQTLYRVDMETGAVLAAFPWGDPSAIYGIRSVASSDRQVCVVLGAEGVVGYHDFNRPVCWDHLTHERIEGTPGLVTDATKISMALHYSPRTGKFYSLNATATALVSEVVDGYKVRDGFLPNTPGTVTEFSCQAGNCAVTRTFPVGSVPQGVTEDESRGVLYIANSGDGSISTIDLATGNVVTRSLSGFTGFRHPMRLLLDPVHKRLLVSDYESKVVALDPVTLTAIGGVTTGDMPMGMTLVGNEIWVALPRKEVFSGGDGVAVLDRSTLALKRVIRNVGPQPWAILAP